ncbi:glycosyltransferase [Bacillus canaveralius]|uniref:Glycosyltransferase n=1 Tax=Bacillus canaveralius TaxID=1403243 RepID=A0A2N5GI79_9BACI|nr:glycosyltransferase family 2 protein [Bacillus canaveralius]PLR80624.1 glycosyltransferase [Bacillus canaveralius]PLR88528.1 glycosyltransferase [Bacillus canaveralius]RSK54150.1 glycosyltransferase [Bacillus canaveralius]
MKFVSIIVPCFNEEESIELFYNTVKPILEEIHMISYEFVFVNDGSKDRTELVMKELSLKEDCVRFVNFSRNFGKEAAMLAGIEAAKGDAVVLMDVDLQDPPELLPEMIHEWHDEGYDVVYTRRSTRSGEPPIRSWFAKQFYKLINNMSDVHIVDGARDYRLMDRKAVDSFLQLKERNRFAKGLFMWVGYRSKCLEFENVERAAGSTSWSFWKLVHYAIDGIVSFTIVPLRWATYFGFFSASASFLFMFYVIFKKIFLGDSVSGYASMVSIMLFFGGIQLIFLGIIGEYIGRIFIEVKARPHYITKEQSEDMEVVKGKRSTTLVVRRNS